MNNGDPGEQMKSKLQIKTQTLEYLENCTMHFYETQYYKMGAMLAI